MTNLGCIAGLGSRACYLFHAFLLLGVFFCLEDEGDLFLPNVGSFSAD
jgi:hypothetical protein